MSRLWTHQVQDWIWKAPGKGRHLGDLTGLLENQDTTETEGIPSAPSNLVATTASSSQINTTWTDNSSQENDFELQYDTSSLFPSPSSVFPAKNATSYPVTGLNQNTTYYFRIRARAGIGNSGWSNTDSATTQAAGGLHPNEPGSMSQITERDFDVVSEDGWGTTGSMVIDTDTGAPKSQPNVGRIRLFAAAIPPGSSLSSGQIWKGPFTGVSEIYGDFYIKLDSGWEGHSSGVNKTIWCTVGSPNPSWPGVFSAQGVDAGTLNLQWRNQGSGGAFNLGASEGGGEIVRGTWHRVEFHMVMNTGDNSDGELHVWLDDSKTHEYTNVSYVNNPTSHLFNTINWNPIWGGTNDTLNATQDMTIDYFYLSGK